MISKLNDKFIRALIEYSPMVIAKYLFRENDGTVCFNRDSLVHSESDMIKFHYILNKDYSSGYDDIQNLTVYFEIKDNFIIGGAYNLRSKQKISRRKLISVTVNTPYTYKNEDFEILKETINTLDK